MIRMPCSRRAFLAQAAAFTAFRAHAQGASASGPTRMVIPFAAGGATDVLGRDLAKAMGATLGQTFVVENFGGGAGVPALQKVVGARPDGTTLLVAASGNITAQPLLQKPRVDISARPAWVASRTWARSCSPGPRRSISSMCRTAARRLRSRTADAAELADMIRKERETWDRVIRDARIEVS